MSSTPVHALVVLTVRVVPARSVAAGGMRLIILDDAGVVADWAARFVLQRITEFAPGPGRHFVLGLPTGGTPLGMYRRLIDFYKEGRLSFKHVTTFNMDEYVGRYHLNFKYSVNDRANEPAIASSIVRSP